MWTRLAVYGWQEQLKCLYNSWLLSLSHVTRVDLASFLCWRYHGHNSDTNESHATPYNPPPNFHPHTTVPFTRLRRVSSSTLPDTHPALVCPPAPRHSPCLSLPSTLPDTHPALVCPPAPRHSPCFSLPSTSQTLTLL